MHAEVSPAKENDSSGRSNRLSDMERFACGYGGENIAVQRHVRAGGLTSAETLQVQRDNGIRRVVLSRPTEAKQDPAKQRKARVEAILRGTKWGFGIGGGLLLLGFVASKAVKHLKTRSVRSGDLPAALSSRIEALRSVLGEVCPMTKEQWLDRLKRDLNPEKELLWWERVSECFKAFVTARTLSSAQKQAAFKVIFGLCSGLREQDLASDLVKLPRSALFDLTTLVGSLPH